ncbi:NAD(P)-dependent oxidoreductase [Pseudoclavibacter sp. VKM Ac-2867]|uniref:NAD(P)-dependent oxidoreductase n=1 Tax=Pseudoclavibacter sp. VKM Ac-2867 TaxID=2783829 RepID=UPI00188BD49E|nr:NAD(P)-dependent oxidoreductase [Pseudoclavibacter sp. VKM Ac-2867]MBF4458083.1 hydroxyacid dehydrogenase [Pseudoclavibacter sp. VKM Ac-2867]
MSASSTQVQHTARLAEEATQLEGDARPETGAVTLLPEGDAAPFADAVVANGGRLVDLGPETRGIVYLSASKVQGLIDALEANPQVTWVQLPFAGIDNFAARLKPHAERGVLFTSAKGAYAEPVAEHALALTLGLLREFPRRLSAHTWEKKTGTSLYGRHVVIIGAGGIALELLDLLKPFRVTTTIVRARDLPVEGSTRTVTADRLDEVLPDADVVIVAAAATEETRGLINEQRLRAMKEAAVLVNIARGPLVDPDALQVALEESWIAGAGLDVTSPEPLPDGHPLWTTPRLIITPHAADTPEMVQPLLQERVRRNVEAFVSTGRFVGIADPVRGY